MSERHAARRFFADPVRFASAHPERIVELHAIGGDMALIQDPAEAWRILVTDAARFRQGKWKRRARRFLGPTLNTLNGAEHRERRLLLQPALDRRRVLAASPRLWERAERLQRGWREGDEIRLRETLDPLALSMAADVLLGADLGPDEKPLAEALAVVMRHVPGPTPPLPGTRAARALRTVRASARRLLRDCNGGDDAGTLLGILRASGLPERTCIGEITGFLLAAVDEPPSGLASAWWHLGFDEERDGTLHAALVAAGEPGEDVPYLEAVIDESLRLLPPARHVDRCPVADETIAGTRVRAGTNVLISPLVLHHDPRLHREPEAFMPERWLSQRGDGSPKGTYLPFGAGPHTCIGEPLARLIMTVTLGSIARRWRLRPIETQRPPTPGAPDLRFTLVRR